MILARHSLETNARPDAIWARWLDVRSWPEWDPRLQEAGLDGPFQPGTGGFLGFGGGRRGFILRTVDPGCAFVLELPVAGARLLLEHRLEEAPHGARVSVEVRAEGWLAWLQARRLGAALQAGLPPALRALARVAERPL